MPSPEINVRISEFSTRHGEFPSSPAESSGRVRCAANACKPKRLISLFSASRALAVGGFYSDKRVEERLFLRVCTFRLFFSLTVVRLASYSLAFARGGRGLPLF